MGGDASHSRRPVLGLHAGHHLSLSPHLASPGPAPPNMHVQLFAKMDPTAEACVFMSTLIMGCGPHPFWPPGGLPAVLQTRKP